MNKTDSRSPSQSHTKSKSSSNRAIKNTLSPMLQKQQMSQYELFRGSNAMEMSWLYYLEKYLPDLCMLGERHDKYNQTIRPFLFDFDARSNTLSVDNRFWTEIETCKKKRLVMLVLTIHTLYKNSTHANALVFDLKKGTVTRFEPRGAHGHVSVYDANVLDNAIKREMNISASKSKSNGQSKPLFLTYNSPSDTCPIMGPQIKASLSKTYGKKMEKVSGKEILLEAGGFCSAWTLMFMHLKLLNPDASDRNITKYLMEKDQDVLATMIRKYMSLIVSNAKKTITRNKWHIQKTIYDNDISRIRLYLDVMNSNDLYKLYKRASYNKYEDLMESVLLKIHNLSKGEQIDLIWKARDDLKIAKKIFQRSKLQEYYQNFPEKFLKIFERTILANNIMKHFESLSLNYIKWIYEEKIAAINYASHDSLPPLLWALELKSDSKKNAKISEFIKILLQNDVDVNIQNIKSGVTPLMFAIKFHDIEAMYDILRFAMTKIDFHIRDHDGNFTMDYVVKDPEICNLWMKMHIIKECR